MLVSRTGGADVRPVEKRVTTVSGTKKVGLDVSIAVISLLSGVSLADDNQGGNDLLTRQPAACCTPASRNFPMVNANYGNTMYSNRRCVLPS